MGGGEGVLGSSLGSKIDLGDAGKKLGLVTRFIKEKLVGGVCALGLGLTSFGQN